MVFRSVIGGTVFLAVFFIHGSALGGEGKFPRKCDLKRFGTHYYVNVPRGYFDKEKAEIKWPLVVGLHGAGDKAKNFCGSLWRFAEEGYLILAVKSPGRAWSGSEDKLVFAAIEEVEKNFRVDPKRISLAGFSSGAFFGMPLVFRRPQTFNALLAMGGGTPVGVKPKAMHLHVYLIVGEQDPVKGTIESAHKQLKKRKLDATLRIVPGIGHVYPPEEEMETILKWFHAFSPEGLLEKRLAGLLVKARKGLKKSSLSSAIKKLQEIAGSPVACKTVEEAKEELKRLAEEAGKKIDKARDMAEAGNPKGARSILLGVWRKYRGLREAADAKVMADALE